MLERAMRPLRATTNSETLARGYRERGHFSQAAVALHGIPPFPASPRGWLDESLAVFTSMGRTDETTNYQRMRTNLQDVDDALSHDNPTLLKSTLKRQRGLLDRNNFRNALQLAVTNRPACLEVLIETLRAPNQQRRRAALVAVGLDPIDWALTPNHGNGDARLLSLALENSFKPTPRQVAQAAGLHNSALLQIMAAHNALGVDLAEAFHAAIFSCSPAETTTRVQLLLKKGADPNASLAAGFPTPSTNGSLRERYPDWIHAEPRLTPWMACLVKLNPAAPMLLSFKAHGANLHATEPVTGFNAWHLLAYANPDDSLEVATLLDALRVNANAEGLSNRVRPTALAMLNRAWPGAKPPDTPLFFSRARLNEPVAVINNKPHSAMEMALHFKFTAHIDALFDKQVVPDKSTLLEVSKWGRPALIERFITSRRWPTGQLNGAFSYVLGSRRQRHALSNLDRTRILQALVRAGADANAKKHTATRQPIAAKVCPGSSTAVMTALITSTHEVALPMMQAFLEMGADLHATSNKGATLWHALALSDPPDAVEVANFLAEQRVDILATATGANGPVSALGALEEKNNRNVLLRAVYEKTADEQSNKRARRQTP